LNFLDDFLGVLDLVLRNSIADSSITDSGGENRGAGTPPLERQGVGGARVDLDLAAVSSAA